AKIEADFEITQRLQAEEQEQLTDDKKEKLFMKFLEKKRKFIAAKKAEEKRNTPSTKAQQRSLMCTYLKNMDGWKPRALKNKSELKESSSKRAGDKLDQEITKKQKVDNDQEAAKLKRCLEIVPDDEDDVTIDATPLSSKSSTIIDYK
nr:hypothetical protein [Tanacetum cinerariifolium]